MAYLYDENDPNRLPLEGSAPAAAGGGPAGAPGAAPAPSSGSFSNLSAYFSANPEASKGMADNLAGTLGAEAKDLRYGNDAGVADVTGKLDAAQSHEGRAALLQQQNGPMYTQGQGMLDSYLVGRADPERFKSLRDAFTPPGAPVSPGPTYDPVPADPRPDPLATRADDAEERNRNKARGYAY